MNLARQIGATKDLEAQEGDCMKKKETHLLGSTILAIINVALTGISTKFLWMWYITPFGLPELPFAHAMGIAYVFDLLTYQTPLYPGEEYDQPWYYFGCVSIVTKLTYLYAGWVWHFFM